MECQYKGIVLTLIDVYKSKPFKHRTGPLSKQETEGNCYLPSKRFFSSSFLGGRGARNLIKRAYI